MFNARSSSQWHSPAPTPPRPSASTCTCTCTSTFQLHSSCLLRTSCQPYPPALLPPLPLSFICSKDAAGTITRRTSAERASKARRTTRLTKLRTSSKCSSSCPYRGCVWCSKRTQRKRNNKGAKWRSLSRWVDSLSPAPAPASSLLPGSHFAAHLRAAPALDSTT